MSTYIRIGGVLIVGVLVVLGAFFVSKHQSTASNESGSLVSAAPDRTYIPPTDADNDGVEDWKESLTAEVNNAIKLPLQDTDGPSTTPYEKPTTFTGKFAEALFTDYMAGKIDGATFEDPTDLVKKAMAAVQQQTISKTYSPNDLEIVAQTNQTLRKFGNDIALSLNKLGVETGNEPELVKEALETKRPELIEPLATTQKQYQILIDTLLVTQVPEDMVDEHLALLHSLEALHADIAAMASVFEDPLITLARLDQYPQHTISFLLALRAINTAIQEAGITYTEMEYGAFLHTIE